MTALRSNKCLLEISDLAFDEIELLLQDPVLRREMGEKGAALFAEHSGATIRTVETARQIMGVE